MSGLWTRRPGFTSLCDATPLHLTANNPTALACPSPSRRPIRRVAGRGARGQRRGETRAGGRLWASRIDRGGGMGFAGASQGLSQAVVGLQGRPWPRALGLPTRGTHVANRNFLDALSSATATACTSTALLSATAATPRPQSAAPAAFLPSCTSKMTPILPQTKCGITKRALYHRRPGKSGPR